MTAAPVTLAQVAPGGNIAAIVRETELHGWPHEVTSAEGRAIAYVVLFTEHASAVRCVFPLNTPARAICGVLRPATRHTARQAFAVNVKVWEDGSYRITRRNAR